MSRYAAPEYLIGSAADLTPAAIRRAFPLVRAIVFDFDNTLADYGASELPPDSTEMLVRMGRAGIWNFVATNVYGEEAYERQRMLRRLRDPATGESLVVETVIPETVTPRGQDAHNYRKPAPFMPAYILDTYGLRAEKVVMVGDQMRSDMRCVEELGLPRILVDKRGTHDHGGVRFNRPLETLQRHLGHYGFFPEELTSLEEWSALDFRSRLDIDRRRRAASVFKSKIPV